MKSINQYISENYQENEKCAEFLGNIKKYFNFSSYNITENYILFNDVVFNEDVDIFGSDKILQKGLNVQHLKLNEDGSIVISDEDNIYSIKKTNISESFDFPPFLTMLPLKYDQLTDKEDMKFKTTVNSIMTDALASIIDITERIRHLSVEDMTLLHNNLGNSVAENALKYIIEHISEQHERINERI